MKNLTIARCKMFMKRALKEHGLDAKIVSAKWLGQRSKARCADYYFRVATVTLECNDGRRIRKTVDIDTTGGCRIC